MSRTKVAIVERAESVIEILEKATKNLKTVVNEGRLLDAYLDDPEELEFTLKNLELRISGVVDEVDYFVSTNI